jgi:hypothetical protein
MKGREGKERRVYVPQYVKQVTHFCRSLAVPQLVNIPTDGGAKFSEVDVPEEQG